MAKTKAHLPNNLTVKVRTETGKGASRRARREGKVPAVLYGHGTDPQHLELPARELAAVLRNFGTNAVLTLDVEGTEALALPKQIEIHPIRRNIQHVDLIVVRRGEKVTVEVNVAVEGEAAPGTLVTQETNTLEIESDAMSIPESLTVSVEGVEAGTQVTASQVELPDGVTLVSDPELLVVNVIVAPSEEELEAEGGGPSLEEQADEAEAGAEGDEDGESSTDSESDSDA
jgi:large subunit ribosomal protein L25